MASNLLAFPIPRRRSNVVADERCNSWKSDTLAATRHLARWRERNAEAQTGEAFEAAGLPHDGAVVDRVAFWAYSLAERTRAQVWVQGREQLVPLEASWRRTPVPWALGEDRD